MKEELNSSLINSLIKKINQLHNHKIIKMGNIRTIIWLKGILPDLRHLSIDKAQKDTAVKLLYSLLTDHLKESSNRYLYHTELVSKNIVFYTRSSRILLVLDYNYTAEKLQRDAEIIMYDTIIVISHTPNLNRKKVISVASLNNMVFCAFTIPEIFKPTLKYDNNETSEINVDDEIDANNDSISELILQKDVIRKKLIHFLKKAIPKILQYLDLIVQCISGKCELINQIFSFIN